MNEHTHEPNDQADRPLTGLDTLVVPEPGATFWDDLHVRLLANADTTGSDDPIATTVQVRDIHSAPSTLAPHRAPRRLLAAAAVLVVVVAGLAVVRLARDEDQRPADRTDAVIDDPQGIDLDGFRRDGLGWEPEPSGPYQVFAFPWLSPAEWSTDGVGYDIADTRGTWDWRWNSWPADLTDQRQTWLLEVDAPETAVLALPDGEPVTVRGTQGVVTDDADGAITWLERGTRVTLRWVLADSEIDVAAGLALAADLEPIEVDDIDVDVDQLSSEGTFRRTDATPLGGRMNGLEWWIDVSPDADSGAEEQVSIIVDGQQVAGGGGPPGTPLRITSTMPFGLGRFMAGRVEGDLESVVVQLSDGTLITLPVHDEGDTMLWAVPIPIGLDVVQLQLVAPGGLDVTAMKVPVYLDQIGAVVRTG